MRIIFAGFGELGASVLDALLEHHTVCAVLTHKDGFTNLHGADVEDLARSHGVKTYISAAARDPGLAKELSSLGADLMVSTNWRTEMPPEILGVGRLGAINVHDALLPEYAGLGAVNWVIRDGRDRTGLTVHFMNEQLDTGPILTQTIIEIGPDEYADSVYRRLVAQYGPTALAAVDMVSRGHRGIPQPLGQGSFGHRITLSDTRIDWHDPTTQIVNLVRAQASPYINAWCLDADRRLFVNRAATPLRAVRGTAGRIVAAVGSGVLVACGRTGLADSQGVIVWEVTPEGEEKPVPAVNYFGAIRGARYLV